MSNHITAELVEVIARARVDARQNIPADQRHNIPADLLLPWDEQPPINKHEVRSAVLNQLNEFIPALIAQGWATPEQVRNYRGIANRHAPTGGAA